MSIITLGFLSLIISGLYVGLQPGYTTFTVLGEISLPHSTVYAHYKDFGYIQQHPGIEGVKFLREVSENVKEYSYEKEVIDVMGYFKMTMPKNVLRVTVVNENEVKSESKVKLYGLFDIHFSARFEILEKNNSTVVKETVTITGPQLLCFTTRMVAIPAHEQMMKNVKLFLYTQDVKIN